MPARTKEWIRLAINTSGEEGGGFNGLGIGQILIRPHTPPLIAISSDHHIVHSATPNEISDGDGTQGIDTQN